MSNESQASPEEFLPVDLADERMESADEPSSLLLELIDQSRRNAGLDGKLAGDRDVETAGLPREYAVTPLRD